LKQTFEGTGGYAKAVTTDALATQQQGLARVASGMDAVITTAQVPGGVAPLLITREALSGMKPGSVVVDLACSSGGNVAGSKPDTVAQIEGVIVLGPTNLAAQLAPDASLLYARNVAALLELLIHDGQLHPYVNDDIIAAACIARGGHCVALLPKAPVKKQAPAGGHCVALSPKSSHASEPRDKKQGTESKSSGNSEDSERLRNS
ncbi:MAG: NAD(P)(+) transhydrogenase (Re/Si-specific) subunit alpha, partial [Myxococcota bacterium]